MFANGIPQILPIFSSVIRVYSRGSRADRFAGSPIPIHPKRVHPIARAAVEAALKLVIELKARRKLEEHAHTNLPHPIGESG
jgi:hypothetical protein